MTKDEIIIAQQARIEQLKDAINNLEGELGESWLHRNYPVTYIPLLEALAIPDDLSALRAHDAALTAKHIEICKKLAAENEGLAGEVWCERCAYAIKKGGVL